MLACKERRGEGGRALCNPPSASECPPAAIQTEGGPHVLAVHPNLTHAEEDKVHMQDGGAGVVERQRCHLPACPATTTTTMSTTATTTASTAASKPAMLKSTTKLAFEEPRDEDSSALGQILMDAFATSSRAIFGPLDADVLEYRTSLVRQRVGLMRLYNAGKVDTCHRFMLARDTSSHAVVGFAIWSLEDDWSEGGVNKRASEIDMAPPLSATPKGANPVMFDRCQEEMTRMQRVYMQDRRRCCA